MRFQVSVACRHSVFALAVFAAGISFCGPARAADPAKLVVQVDKPGPKIGPLFYGLMTEEINYSYDGGLYGELIQNRIFKNTSATPPGVRDGGAVPELIRPTPTTGPAAVAPHWSVVQSGGAQGEISLDTTNPVNTVALTTSLRLHINSVGAGERVGVANDGYWGIPVKPDTTYQASFYVRASDGFAGPLTVAIESTDGKTTYASAVVPAVTDTWKKYNVTLKTGQVQPTSAARFVISGTSKGTINFNLVSLFPPTYKDRPNGNRIDISQLLADQKPAFLRFPGGNYVEGNSLADRWNWKATIGPLEERPTHMSPWAYRSSDGMGLLEFMGWCEDLHMEPVVAVFAGYTLGGIGVGSSPGANFTGDALQPYVDEALHELEYLTGDVSTQWGARRAKDGHPAPFKVNYVEIGNEDPVGATSTYPQRFPAFYRAIKAKYPQINVIASTSAYGDVTPDLIDHHFYMSYASGLNNAHTFDTRARTTADGKPAPRIFVGEWATRDGNNRVPTPTFRAALSDAAFLTGMERNADLVVMSCYAPLFVNVSDITGPQRSMQWAGNLIGYDALKSFGSPSYYVQKMFYNNKGDVVLPVTLTLPSQATTAPIAVAPAPATASAPATRGATSAPASGFLVGRGPATPPRTLFASSSRDEATGDIILKVVNAAEAPQQVEISLEGAAAVGKTAKLELLTGGLTEVNTLAEPTKVVPKSTTIEASTKFVREFPGNSVNVMRFTTR